jgi:hypothetical protein
VDFCRADTIHSKIIDQDKNLTNIIFHMKIYALSFSKSEDAK